MIVAMARAMIGTIVIIAGLSLASCTGDGLASPPVDASSTASPSAVPVTASVTRPVAATVSAIPSTLVPSSALSGFEETFDDNSLNWYTNPALVDVQAGTYNQVLDCPASGYSTTCGYFIKIPFTFPVSFRMHIETTITSASSGAAVMVGFQLRRTDDGYYYVNHVLTKGLYEISRVTQTGAFQIVPETPTDFIEQGVGETNVLGIEIKGAELMPLLNGNQISPVQDGNIRTAGDSYLVVLVERGHTAELYFDNLIVENIE